MDPALVLVFMFGMLFFLLLVLRVPVAFGLGTVGAIGTFLWWGGIDNLSILGVTAFRATANFYFLPVPLFILMAELILITGVSGKAFEALERFSGRMRGSLAYSTIALTTIFGAVTGYSPASCAAIGPITIPEMYKRNYDKRLAVGVVGGGAALAILIPPSGLMVIYGGLADVSIGQLFMAGIIPGLVSAALFAIWVFFLGLRRPEALPYGDVVASPKERVLGLVKLLPLAFTIFMVLGTIYLGIATPSEAAAMGCLAAFILVVAYGKLTWAHMGEVLLRSMKANAMLFTIVFTATFFTQVLAYLQVPRVLAGGIVGLEISRWTILSLMMLLVLGLGCLMDPGSIMMILIPIFMPLVRLLGFDPVWYGILFMINLELATLTPPVGMNLFVLLSIVPEGTTVNDIFMGCLPFLLLHLLTMVIVAVIPQLALWLPSMMIGT